MNIPLNDTLELRLILLKQYARYEFGSGSPPTPTASDLSSGERQGTRSSRPTGLSRLPRPQRRSTLDRSPAHNPVKSRKATKNSKNDKPKVPKLDAPLSELTKGYNNIPLKNMDEWVNRSAEVRRNEVEKRNGYVTRPMNSFMLYRSAFAERTKIWCLQNNHQIVSSVSGESWPMEPPDVREQYNEYARIERDNHHKAHPGYKFSPSKAQNSARKRKGISEEPEDENPSDQDPDFEWRPSSTRNSRIKPGKRQGQAAGYQKNSTPRSDAGFGLQQSDLGYNPSSYQASNPGKPLPARMGEHDTYGQYYQTTVHQNENGHNIEDVYLRRMNIPYGHYRSAPPVISLPGARHYELIGNGAFDNTPEPVNENQVDPTLLAYDNSFADHANGFINEQQFKDYNDDLLFGPENFSRSQPSEEASHTNFNSWQLGLVASAEAEDDFAKWMAQNNDR